MLQNGQMVILMFTNNILEKLSFSSRKIQPIEILLNRQRKKGKKANPMVYINDIIISVAYYHFGIKVKHFIAQDASHNVLVACIQCACHECYNAEMVIANPIPNRVHNVYNSIIQKGLCRRLWDNSV